MAWSAGQDVGGYRLERELRPGVWVALRLSDRRSCRVIAVDQPLGVTSLEHPCLVGVEEGGEFDGRCFVVAEFVQGLTLDDELEKGALTLDRAGPILLALCDAFILLHAHGRVLVDLRPQDVLLSPWQGDAVRVPSHAVLLGSAVGRTRGGYTAPETAMDDPTPLSDQYALGVLAYEVLTGVTPHNPDAPPGERTIMPLSTVVPEVPDMDVWIERLMHGDAGSRFSSMEEARTALVSALPPPSTVGHFTPVIRQRTVRPMSAVTPPSEPEVVSEADDIRSFLLMAALGVTAASLLSWALVQFL